MFRKSGVMKKRIFGGTIATVLTVAIVSGVIYFNGNEALAKPTLKGIEELVDNHSISSGDTVPTPFTIYEILETGADAKFGYLVGGEEPVFEGRSIKEMPSRNERITRFDDASYDPSTLDIYGDKKAFSWATGDYRYKEPTTFDKSDKKKTVEIKGDFVEETPGWYDPTDITSDYTLYTDNVEDIYDDKNVNDIVLYRQSEAYRMESGFVGDYSFDIKKIADGTEMPVETNTGIYNFQYFVANEAASDHTYAKDELVYVCDKSASGENLTYFGIITDDSGTLKLTKADGSVLAIGSGTGEMLDPVLDYAYYIVSESSEISSDSYRIVSVTAGGPFGKKSGFVKVEGDVYTATNCSPSKGPYYVENGKSDEYTFISDASGHFNFVADYSKTDVYQKVEYLGGFKNNEWFKQYVLDREEGTECDNLVVDVIPLSANQLTSRLTDNFDSADLIYLAGGYTTDIDGELARKINNAVVNDNLPVIMEYSVYQNAVDNGLVNYQKLALCLMQTSVKAVKDKTAWDALNYNDASAANYLLKTVRFYNTDASKMDPVANDISYVSGTIFINDDIYSGASKVVAADFNASYSENKQKSGFQDILDEYDREKTYIELYDDWSKFNSSVSKATSIRYILNAHKNRAVVKSKLNILDLEPYDTTNYTDAQLLEKNYYDGALYNLKYFSAQNSNDQVERDHLTKNWVTTNIAPHLASADKQKDITITEIGTKEFIGKNDDLNATYDMIYLGMDTSLMNTVNNEPSWNETKRQKTAYNFMSYLFNGKIFTHMGDKIEIDLTKLPYVDGMFKGIKDHYHLAGNDITQDKKRELTEYIQAGYAVILSDGYIKNPQTNPEANKDTLDESSLMYELIRDVVLKKGDDGKYLYYGKNVVLKSSLEATAAATDNGRTRDTFAKYLNISKLTIEVLETPPAYNDATKPDEHGYITQNANGSYTMTFKVKLTNDAAVDASNTTYDCKLYLDMDADGKFEETESLGALEINGESKDKFELKTGNEYTIVRDTPSDYIGFLSWKLAFVQNEKETDATSTYYNNVRSAIFGYSAIKNNGQKRTIRVLQITPNKGNNLDLANDMTIGTGTNKINLYDQVQDFKIDVQQCTISDYIRKKGAFSDRNGTSKEKRNCTYYDFLSEFDMVVIGFADAIEFVAVDDNGNTYANDARVKVSYPDWWRKAYKGADPEISSANAYKDAILGIREYALSGQSILFTHDLSSRVAFDSYSSMGYYANLYLRDIMGMDRYGHVENQNKNLRYINDHKIKLGANIAPENTDASKIPDYESNYDTVKMLGQDIGTIGDDMGLSEADILRFADESGKKPTYGVTTREATTYYTAGGWGSKNGQVETVTAVNEGQITQYPFLITEGVSGDDKSQFDVSGTHSQYFQLNLDTNSRDDQGNDDVVVWYTISNNTKSEDNPTNHTELHQYYRALHNDVRNNYYIYSKGNVLYTGSGHSKVTSEQEKKLFVNTLVASYNNGLHKPTIAYKENPWDSAVNISGTSLPYDPKMTINETLTEQADLETNGNQGGFIGETVKINFKTLNSNFRESKKPLYVQYYLKDENGGVTIDGVKYTVLKPTTVKKVNVTGSLEAATSSYELENYQIYQATFKLGDLKIDKASVDNNKNAVVYTRISTKPIADATNKENHLESYESMSSFTISTMKLYDLK